MQRINSTFRYTVALLAMAAASVVSTASAMPCCMADFPLTTGLVSGIQEQFGAVPALGIAAAVPDAFCLTSLAVATESHSPIAARCSVAVTCRNGEHFSFYLLNDGQVHAPKGLGRLLAEECPENISDPGRRDALVKDYEDELQSLGAWLHRGLEK